MSTELDKKMVAGLPEHLQEFAGKARMGNLDESDMIVPRIQLLQALSPEITQYDEAKPGNFWHNIAGINLGTKITAVMIVMRKSVVLWGPRSEENKLPLARALDGIHWDLPNTEFTFKPKGSSQAVTYNTRGSVAESGLLKFGTSIPDDKNSNPAASLTYNTMWYLPDYPELSPAVVINTRSQIKPTQTMYNMMANRPGMHYVQLWDISAVSAKGAEGPYFNIAYRAAGYADKPTAELCQVLWQKYDKAEWGTADESETPEATEPSFGKDEVPF